MAGDKRRFDAYEDQDRVPWLDTNGERTSRVTHRDGKVTLLERSQLRKDAIWHAFLDTIHPQAEHAFFGGASFNGATNHIEVRTKFERDHIANTYGERLRELLRAPVVVTVDPHFRLPSEGPQRR